MMHWSELTKQLSVATGKTLSARHIPAIIGPAGALEIMGWMRSESPLFRSTHLNFWLMFPPNSRIVRPVLGPHSA